MAQIVKNILVAVSLGLAREGIERFGNNHEMV